MESDTSSEHRFGYHTCITVYPLLITRISEQCDLKRLLNEYIFKGDNAHHEKYMIINSGSIENGQFTIYFTNNVSAESIYETMKSELFFSCTIPRKQFLTQPNKDRFIPQTMRKWRWKKEINLNQDFAQYSFENCYQIEHALENKHDTVILAIKDKDQVKDQENTDINTQNVSQNKKRKSKSKKKKKSKKSKKSKAKDDEYDIIASWHLIIFNEEYSQKNKNVANICKTDQIEIESETCHHGLVTKMDWDNQTGYVRNREWNVIHSFEINATCDTIRENQLISFTLCVPQSFYVSVDPITPKDCIATNIDIMSGAMLSRRTPIKYPDKLNGDLVQFQKLSLFTPSNASGTSSEGSPIMFISPKQRAIHQFTVNQPRRRHSVTSTHHQRSNSRFVVKHGGHVYDTDDIHELLIRNYGAQSKSTPYRIHMHHLQSKTADLRNVSREVSLALSASSHGKIQLNSPSPSASLRSLAAPLSPLSEIGSDHYVAPNKSGNITPSSSVDRQIENSESREKSERYCLLDMASWSDKEFTEFLTLIGEQDFIHAFNKNAVKPNHLKVADEPMLRSLGLPLIHIKNILMERDYYKNADQQLQSLAYVNVTKEDRYALELKLKEIKTIMNNSRVSRLKLQRLKCRQFALRHHEVVQMTKEYIEIIEDAMEEPPKANHKGKANKAKEGEFKETILTEEEEDTESEEEKEWEDNKILVFRAERELVSGCNRLAASCVGCVSLQLMNMNYIKCNFGESSVGLVRLQIEEQLIDKINQLLARYASLRVHIYKSMDVLYYTLIICDRSDNDDLGFKGFRSFLQNDLTEIGFRIPLFWKRDSDKTLLWKRQSVNDIYSDIDKLGNRERRTSGSDSDQLEGMSKRGGGLWDVETSEIEHSMSRCSIEYTLSDTKSPKPRKSFSSLNIDNAIHVPLASPSKEMSKLSEKEKTPRKSKSKFKSLKKGLKKRLSISSKKKKNKAKKKASLSCKKELGDVDEHRELKQLEELRQYGFDNESLNLSEHNQIYFMMGSVHIGMQKANLYQEIQKVRKTVHKNLENRSKMYQNRQQLNGDMISASSVNDLFFVKRL